MMIYRSILLRIVFAVFALIVWSCGYVDDQFNRPKHSANHRQQNQGSADSEGDVGDGGDQNLPTEEPQVPTHPTVPHHTPHPAPNPHDNPNVTPDPPPPPPPPPTFNTIEDTFKTISESEIKQDLFYLASDELAGRGTATSGGQKAADFIAKRFAELEIQPGLEGGKYMQVYSAHGGETSNVVGILEGTDPDLKNQVIVIGAHYDHLGIQGGSIFYGADDNASGTVGVIFVAKALGLLKHKIKRTILFVTFSGEELGLLGSEYYASNPAKPIKDTIYMINMDMVGYYGYQRQNTLEFLGGSMSHYAETLMQKIMKNFPDIQAGITLDAGGGSDHVSFIEKGVPSVFMHTGLHPNYHQVTDTPDKINYPALTSIIKMAAELAWEIDQGAEKPSMDQHKPLAKNAKLLDHGVTPFQK